MPTGVSVPLTFQLFRGEQLVRTLTLTQDINTPVKIGKLSSSHLRIDDDEGVSRMHAVIEITSPTDIYIIDLGSTKGTIVNGEKIVNRQKLQSGDQILLGETKLVIEIGEAVTVEAAPAEKSAPAPMRSTVMGMKAINVPPPGPIGVPPPTAAAAPPAAQKPAPAALRPQTFTPPPLPPGLAEAVEVRDGSRAVEVVAMFEDAIIETRHFTNPQSGVVTGATKGLIATGALSLVGAFILFVVAWFQVDALGKAREVWERANPGKSPSDFPMPHEGPLMDIAVAMLLALGIVALIWGLIRLFDERAPRHFTIGPDPKALVSVPAEQVPAA